MIKYEMLPTEENLIETLNRDTIGRNKDIAYFYEILEAQMVSSTIAIDGRWGSGKTFFVRQEKMLLNALNPRSDMSDEIRLKIIKSFHLLKGSQKKENSSLAVYYDAWENDNDTEPILSLIYEMTKQLSMEFSLSDEKILKIAGAIIEAISGRNVNGIKEALRTDDPFTKFKEQKEVEENIKEFISGLLEERANRLVVFVDELDRCKPTFTVHLLEQIKHYIFDDRITFVFSVNLEQLQHTIRHYYGPEFDSCRYLDRFFDLRMTIPPVDKNKFYMELGIGSSYYIDSITKRIIDMFHFEMREITRFYAQVKAAVYAPTHNSAEFDFDFPNGQGKQFVLLAIVPLLIGLKIADINKYDDFVNGKNSQPLKELFNVEKKCLLFNTMLNDNEAFEKVGERIVVTQDEIIDRVYDAIFIKDYSGSEYCTNIGQVQFSASSKKLAVNASSMMSRYTQL